MLNIVSIKLNTEKTVVKSLIKILYNEYNDLFMNKLFSFIKVMIMFMIQQKLLNVCCSTDESKATQKDSVLIIVILTSEKVKFREFFTSLTFKAVSVTVNIEDFNIQMHLIEDSAIRQFDQSFQLSAVTIENVTSKALKL